MAGSVADLEPARRLYTAGQCRALDAKVCAAFGISSYSLMERAGTAVFDAARRICPAAQRWTILCGAGNNGGDGYVIARLAQAAGLQVELFALRAPSALAGDAALAAQAWLSAGGSVCEWRAGVDEFRLEPDDLLVDAVLGTGLEREVTGEFRGLIEAANAVPCPRLAVDLPSGLNADTGRSMGLTLRADFTVTLIGAKAGLYTADGADYAGRIVFAGLDVPLAVHAAIPGAGRLLNTSDLNALGLRQRNSHKGSFGHVLVAGGNRGMSGAARLASEAALRCGAGLVSLATHAEHAPFLNLERPELMVHGIDPVQAKSASSRGSSAGEGDALTTLLDRASVLALGPGLGQDAWARALLARCLAAARIRNLPVVLDADALNLLAEKQTEKGSEKGSAEKGSEPFSQEPFSPEKGSEPFSQEPFSQTTFSKKGSDPFLQTTFSKKGSDPFLFLKKGSDPFLDPFLPLGALVLTPHPAEAARLLRISTAEVQADRVSACRALAKRYRAVCVLKGCGTVVADHEAEWAICSLGNPGLASGGSGDLLTGVIAALLAQGVDAWSAAALGVTAHAYAADLAAQTGERGMLASDLLTELRRLVNPSPVPASAPGLRLRDPDHD